jgi:polysaccharide export outer membrane protein
MRILNSRTRALKAAVPVFLALAWAALPLAQAQQAAGDPKEAVKTEQAAVTAAPTNKEAKVTESETPSLEQLQAMAKELDNKPSANATAAVAAAPVEPAEAAKRVQPGPIDLMKGFDPLKYTLGPDDVVEISVMRHPEFSGTYSIDQEGKLQYKFVGDMQVVGLTKFQLEGKIREIISKYVIEPEVNVTVTEFRSKVFYVLGEVGAPGKYYMRSEDISVRDAVVLAGLPTQAAAMRKCRIITPNEKGGKVRDVNIYELLYNGDLSKNLVMKPGDFLYVPSTVMAKMFRVIAPASSAVATAVSPMDSLSTGKDSRDNLSGGSSHNH